jgi:hypothetical protein
MAAFQAIGGAEHRLLRFLTTYCQKKPGKGLINLINPINSINLINQ